MKTINLEIQVPDWVKWIAMDSDGSWNGFLYKPHVAPYDAGYWMNAASEKADIAIEVGEPSYPNWQQSLRKV